MEQIVGATRRCHLHRVHPGHPSTTHGRGASPCGRSRLPVVSLARRRPCSLVLPRGFPPRPRGWHPPLLRGLGLPDGTRRPWPTPSTPLLTPVYFFLFTLRPPLFLRPLWSPMDCLSDVLVAPSMVHSLLSIRHFTADNSCFVEFDSSSLTVKDLAYRRPLLRCDSTGPLYTLRFPASASPPSPVLSAAFATTTSTTWHRRLGHPGRDALMQLSRSSDI